MMSKGAAKARAFFYLMMTVAEWKRMQMKFWEFSKMWRIM